MKAPRLMCLHQIFRPCPSTFVPTPGWGNCLMCTPHHDNIKCMGYCPVGLTYIHVDDVDGWDHFRDTY